MSRVTSIFFVGTYKPIMCGIGDYTYFITRESPAKRWGVLSFDPEKYGAPLVNDNHLVKERVWYGIPGRHEISAPVILEGLKYLDGEKEESVLWFQHEFGLFPDRERFVAMLKNLDVPKVVSFHSLHFQSTETSTGLRREQYDFLKTLLPHVEAITVFSNGVYNAVTSAFPKYQEKVYVIKHGIHSYPEVSRLSRKEAKEKFNDFLLYESNLDQKDKKNLNKQHIFIDSNTVVIGQTGFMSPAKGSELLYPVRDILQKNIPHKRIVAMCIGTTRDDIQKSYIENLRRKQNGIDKFLLETYLPQNMLPLAQRALDINFYWPRECTQSGVLAHALGAGAIVAGRDLEGVGETLKEAAQPADIALKHLLLKIQQIISNPGLRESIEERTMSYAAEFSWMNQSRRHYELAEACSTMGAQLVSNVATSVNRSHGITSYYSPGDFNTDVIPGDYRPVRISSRSTKMPYSEKLVADEL